MRMFRIAVAVGFSVFLGQFAQATELKMPQGRILLEVAGQIGATNEGGVALFDVEMLRELDWQEIQTYTAYTEGPQTFGGPTLSSLLTAVEAHGSTLQATAINDYFVEINVGDAEQFDVLLAVEQNGRPMRVRNKGPIWVIYPMTEAQAARKEHDNEMIWQLDRIVVVN